MHLYKIEAAWMQLTLEQWKHVLGQRIQLEQKQTFENIKSDFSTRFRSKLTVKNFSYRTSTSLPLPHDSLKITQSQVRSSRATLNYGDHRSVYYLLPTDSTFPAREEVRRPCTIATRPQMSGGTIPRQSLGWGEPNVGQEISSCMRKRISSGWFLRITRSLV